MRKLLTLFAICTVLYFFGKFLLIYGSRAESVIGAMAPVFFIAAVGMVFVAFFLQISAWHLSFTMNGVLFNRLISSYLYCAAVLAAYIPGKIPGILVTAQLAKDHGSPRLGSTISIVTYQVMSLVACGAMSLVFLGMAAEQSAVGIEVSIVFLVIVGGLFVTRSAYLNWMIQKVARALKKDVGSAIKTSFAENALLFLTLCVVWAVMVIMVNLLRSAVIGSLNFDGFAMLGAAFLLSQILGAIVILVPSGIGVFETSFYLSVRHAFSEEEAIALVALSRLVMVIPAALCYPLFKLMRRVT